MTAVANTWYSFVEGICLLFPNMKKNRSQFNRELIVKLSIKSSESRAINVYPPLLAVSWHVPPLDVDSTSQLSSYPTPSLQAPSSHSNRSTEPIYPLPQKNYLHQFLNAMPTFDNTESQEFYESIHGSLSALILVLLFHVLVNSKVMMIWIRHRYR